MKTRVLGPLCIALSMLIPVQAASISHGAELEIRLLQQVGSRVSNAGDPVRGVVITPIMDGDSVAISAGSTVSGVVTRSDRLGLGLRHQSARLDLNFTRLELPDGTSVPLSAQVVHIEEARETVDGTGAIIGIHSTASLSTGVSLLFSLSLMAEPEFRLPIVGVKFLVARAPDAEISFPTGTDLVLRLKKDLRVLPPQVERPVPTLSAREKDQIGGALASLPEQISRKGKHPSDLVNLAFIGDPGEIARAFHAAGWTDSEPRGAMALYHVYRCVAQRVGYSLAAMANLKLNGRVADMSFQKSLNTFAKRHHIRLWHDKLSGIWLAAATEDTEYRMRALRVTHAIDQQIDHERAKVVNDLVFTGCVTAGELIPRPNLRAVGDDSPAIVTDGSVAALQMSQCGEPRTFPSDKKGPVPVRAVRVARALVQDVVRSNPASVLYAVSRSMIRQGAHSTERTPYRRFIYSRDLCLQTGAGNKTSNVSSPVD